MSEPAAPADLLFIAANFFGYAKEISAELERRGRRVLWFEDRPATDTLTKATLRVAPSLVAARAETYFDAIAARAAKEAILDVLVIKGEALSIPAIQRLRMALPNARFTLFFWDGYGNMPADSPRKVDLFDRAFTFDLSDSRADPRLTYRPLFYLDRYASLPAVEQDIDLLFFGTAHGDRYPVLKRLQRALPPGLRFEQVLYFPSRLVYRLRRVFDHRLRGARRSEFIFQPLPKEVIMSLLARTRIVVDIERPVQTGLTIRTLECLGAGRKLATTNASVLQADFYHPANVAVFDRDQPVLTADFLRGTYVPPPPELLRRYALSGWINDVLPQD